MQEAGAVDVAHAVLLVEQEDLEHVAEEAGPGAVGVAELGDRLAEVASSGAQRGLVRRSVANAPVGPRLVERSHRRHARRRVALGIEADGEQARRAARSAGRRRARGRDACSTPRLTGQPVASAQRGVDEGDDGEPVAASARRAWSRWPSLPSSGWSATSSITGSAYDAGRRRRVLGRERRRRRRCRRASSGSHGAACSRRAHRLPAWRGASARPAGDRARARHGSRASRRAATRASAAGRSGSCRSCSCPKCMRCGRPSLRLREVDGEERRELLAVPAVGLQELLVVLALLVPVREQRRREVDALAVPGLRDHVHLRADLLLVHDLLRVLGSETSKTRTVPSMKVSTKR